MARSLCSNWTFIILLSSSAASQQEDSDHPGDEEFDGHGFMVNVLVGVIVFIFALMVMLVICINNTCIKRYLKARQLVIKAAQYRPAKYKKVFPTTAASIQAISSIYPLQEFVQEPPPPSVSEERFKEI